MPRLRPTALAIAVLAGSVMIFEVALIRLFSFVTWYHFASMVISVALLGFGVSGVILERRPGLGRPPRRRAALYSGLFGLTSVAAVFLLGRLTFDLLSVTRDPAQVARLALVYVVLLVPFTCAGLAIATLLSGFTERAGLLYGCDLVGAAVGCVAVVFGTARIGIEGVIVAAAALAAAAAWLLSLPAEAGEPRGPARAWAGAALVLALLLPVAPAIFVIEPGPGKSLRRYLENSPDVEPAFTRWSSLYRTDVIENGAPVPWTVNRAAGTAPVEQHQIAIDGDALTPMVRLAGVDESSLAFLDYMLPALPYEALRPERVLVIGSGGGTDVLAALHHGASRVDAVEVNADIVRLVKETYAGWNDGLFLRGEVSLHLDEGRSFVRRSSERYDVIQLSLVDTWASSAAGAYSLTEGYLYTVEAFEDYLGHLTDGGVVSMSRWLHSPPRETLRLVAVAATALERLGYEQPERHVVVANNGRVSTTLVKKTPFRDDEIRALVQVARERFHRILYLPGFEPETGPFAALLHHPDREELYDRYEFDVSPTTDERPFFFQFLRWRQLRSASFSGKGLLLVVFLQALVLSLLLLVVPLVRRRKDETGAGESRGAVRVAGYFLLLGVAFMLVEIVLMQRFTLYLGHPVYGIALVLAVLLLGAGAGSLTAARTVPRGGRAEWLFVALLALIAVYALALPLVLRATLGWALAARLAFAAVLILPIAFLLGIPFPAAFSRLRGGGAHTGLAWAANGCGSVLGPLLAVILALDLGYGRVMLIGAVLYGAAYLVFWKSRSESHRDA